MLADAVNIAQRYVAALVRWNIDTSNTCHDYVSLSGERTSIRPYQQTGSKNDRA
jgi:hypothetical protein